jgi:hypothetical protein
MGKLRFLCQQPKNKSTRLIDTPWTKPPWRKAFLQSSYPASLLYNRLDSGELDLVPSGLLLFFKP